MNDVSITVQQNIAIMPLNERKKFNFVVSGDKRVQIKIFKNKNTCKCKHCKSRVTVPSPVLHLHQVTHQTVARTALYKVLLGRQKALTVDLPEFLDEIFL